MTPGILYSFPNVSPSLWAKIQAAAEQRFGVAFSGSSGSVSKDGITVAYTYTPSTQVATVQVVKRGFLDPDEADLDEDLRVWFEQQINLSPTGNVAS